MSRIERTSKNLQPKFFRNCTKKNDSQENFVRHSLANIAKIARITNLSKFLTYEGKRQRRASRRPQISPKSQKSQEFFLLPKKTETNIARIARITNLPIRGPSLPLLTFAKFVMLGIDSIFVKAFFLLQWKLLLLLQFLRNFVIIVIDRFHMTSRRPYLCTKKNPVGIELFSHVIKIKLSFIPSSE